jgi:hypothetical protein
VLNQRLAGDERERLAGEPRRGVTRGDDANNLHTAYLATAPADSSRRNAMKAETRIEGGIELKTVQVTFTSTMSNNPTESFKLRHRNKMRMMIFTGKRTILGR